MKLDEYIASTYGDKLADVYDDWFSSCDPLMIDVLAELAQNSRALELGIGTGRIAIPLASRGVEVVGIDASEAMIGKLAEVRRRLDPDGMVFVEGALWQAISEDGAAEVGDWVRVSAVHDLRLVVRRLDSETKG